VSSSSSPSYAAAVVVVIVVVVVVVVVVGMRQMPRVVEYNELLGAALGHKYAEYA